MHARHRLLSVQIGLELLTVVARRFVLWPVVHFFRCYRDPLGEAGAHLVGHDQHHVGVRDELHAEGALAPAVAKSKQTAEYVNKQSAE